MYQDDTKLTHVDTKLSHIANWNNNVLIVQCHMLSSPNVNNVDEPKT